MTTTTPIKTLLTALAAAALAACGGGGDSPDPVVTPPVTTSKFTQNATWNFTLPAAGSSVCYDFDAKAQAACTGNQWDVKVVSGGRSAELFTNSGPSSTDGSGNGGAFGTPFVHTWTDLQKWNDALVDPVGGALPATVYTADTAKSAFSGSNAIQSAAYEYDLNGTHQMHPNFRVFLITTNSASSDISGSAGLSQPSLMRLAATKATIAWSYWAFCWRSRWNISVTALTSPMSFRGDTPLTALATAADFLLKGLTFIWILQKCRPRNGKRRAAWR